MTPSTEVLTCRGPLVPQDLFIRHHIPKHQPGDGKGLGDTGEFGTWAAAPGPQQRDPHVSDLPVHKRAGEFTGGRGIVSEPVLGTPRRGVTLIQRHQAATGATVITEQHYVDPIPQRPVQERRGHPHPAHTDHLADAAQIQPEQHFILVLDDEPVATAP